MNCLVEVSQYFVVDLARLSRTNSRGLILITLSSRISSPTLFNCSTSAEMKNSACVLKSLERSRRRSLAQCGSTSSPGMSANLVQLHKPILSRQSTLALYLAQLTQQSRTFPWHRPRSTDSDIARLCQSRAQISSQSRRISSPTLFDCVRLILVVIVSWPASYMLVLLNLNVTSRAPV